MGFLILVAMLGGWHAVHATDTPQERQAVASEVRPSLPAVSNVRPWQEVLAPYATPAQVARDRWERY